MYKRQGKGELLDYLAANSGTAFYLSDDAVLSEMVAERPNLYAIPYNASGLTRDDDGEMIGVRWEAVSYTHLDVYKRQDRRIAPLGRTARHFGKRTCDEISVPRRGDARRIHRAE